MAVKGVSCEGSEPIMKIEKFNETPIAILEPGEKISNIDDVLDMIGNASYNDCFSLIVDKDNLDASFFNLRTGFAGEMLQKFSNYGMRIAIIGDFSAYTSKSLQDFIYECNKGNQVFFKGSREEAIAALARK